MTKINIPVQQFLKEMQTVQLLQMQWCSPRPTYKQSSAFLFGGLLRGPGCRGGRETNVTFKFVGVNAVIGPARTISESQHRVKVSVDYHSPVGRLRGAGPPSPSQAGSSTRAGVVGMIIT